ncbi:hypothetical protein FDH01_gp292 [Acinetobacter phage vB_AbaM_ME3]|uniref:Uncharacterized protein n=1 Tax=Acinetobacter phage vB_AbaM_ME3 TaxID=1837876 RepID=A0A172Q0E2_9CAUD|nr:hypothetical protein FDH01_gp292 [Acinetobacter phage vB_AbaM_ME3]AND75330.1 hypothetical protein ME3_169 [Acinetobacter phage vB_AbaM_ME3]
MIVSLGDFISFAEKECNHSWNGFITLLEKDKVIPYYENSLLELYPSIGKDYGWSDEVSNVVKEFCNQYNTGVIINLSDY